MTAATSMAGADCVQRRRDVTAGIFPWMSPVGRRRFEANAASYWQGGPFPTCRGWGNPAGAPARAVGTTSAGDLNPCSFAFTGLACRTTPSRRPCGVPPCNVSGLLRQGQAPRGAARVPRPRRVGGGGRITVSEFAIRHSALQMGRAASERNRPAKWGVFNRSVTHRAGR